MTFRIGVIGLGVISRYYLAALAARDDAKITALSDTKPAAAARTGLTLPVYRDYRDLLASGLVDAVIVNVPNHLHYQVCRDSLLAGVHVCCEKPLALEPTEAHDLADRAKQTGRCLFTAFHRRYNSNILQLAHRMQRKQPPRTVVLTYRERIEDHCGDDPWYLDATKCGGGCVADNGPNAFDTVLQLLGPLTPVSAKIGKESVAGVDLEARVILTTSWGGTVRIELDWAFDSGEDKAVAVSWDDGSQDSADMLDGYPAFKSSLDHEYRGVVTEFLTRLAGEGTQRQDNGPLVADLVAQTYRLTRERAG